MALRWIDSFDHYAHTDLAAKYNAVGGTPISGSGNGRRSTNSYRTTTASTLTKGFDAQSTWIVGFAFRTQNMPSTGLSILAWLDGGSVQCDLNLQNDGSFTIRRAGLTTIATSSAGVTAGVFHYLEVRIVISDAAGIVHIKLNGETLLLAGSLDTKQTTNATANSIRIGCNNNGSQGNFDIDDLYICDGSSAGSPSVNVDFLGDVRVDCLFPNGNGNSSQFTGSDGNSVDNYLLVDDTSQDGDSTYVESSTLNQRDTYAFGNLSHSPTSIFGIQVNAYARKDDAGARSIATVVRSGGADTDGTSQGLTTSYVNYSQIVEQDPNTAAAWTQTNLNAAEFGHVVSA